MRNTRNSFLKFLEAELPSIEIHPLTINSRYPEDALLKLNCLNVNFLNTNFDPHINEQTVSLDVIFEKENDGVDAVEDIFDLLSKRFFIPKYDYTVPSVPVSLNSNIYWDKDVINFTKISNNKYYHANTTFNLKHYRALA